MAPKKGAKRGRPSNEELKAKAAKVSKPQLNAILEVITSKKDLNEDCRDMLGAMLPFSLCVPANERDDHQASVVQMVQEVFDATAQEMKAAVAAATADVEAAEAARAELEGKAAEAEAVLAAAAEAAEARKAAKASAAAYTAEMKAALSEREGEQKKGDAEGVALQAEKETLESALATEWKALIDGSWEKPPQQKKLYAVVASLTKKLALEESMLAALPGAAAKKPSDRGSFDQMVLTECAQKFAAKVAELSSLLEAVAPAMAERAAAVQAAEAAVAAAKAAQDEAGEQLSAAQGDHKEKTGVLKKAKDAVAAAGPGCDEVAADLEAKKVGLSNFTEYNLSIFESLRDASSKQEEAPPEDAAAPKEAEAAETPAPEA